MVLIDMDRLRKELMAKGDIPIHEVFNTIWEQPIVNVSQQKWISVSERLPEEDGLYLVIGLGIYLGEYSPFIFKREKTSPSNTLKWVQEIVAWMPLPEPYKEGEK